MLDMLVPDIDEGIPLPARAVDAMPSLSPREELEMRARTIKLLAEISDTSLTPSEVDKQQATELIKQMNREPNGLTIQVSNAEGTVEVFHSPAVRGSKVSVRSELLRLQSLVD